MAIIITKQGKEAKKLAVSNFAHEDDLQNFIYENPDTVPLYEIDENIRLLIVAREVPTRSGSIDAVGMDANGEVYLIETKLYKNPDKRLVVAQVLDYGASVSENIADEEEFMHTIENKTISHFKIALNEKISSFFNLTRDEAMSLLSIFKENLSGGRFRFVVLMDHVEKRLRDLISFLNRNCNFSIYGVELEFYKYDEFEITIPKLIGAEVKKEVSSSTGSMRRKWDKDSFFTELNNCLNQDEVARIKNFYEFFVKHADSINWGTGNRRGSFNPIFKKLAPRSLLSVFTDGTLILNYSWMTGSNLSLRSKYYNILKNILSLPAEDSGILFPTFTVQEWLGSIPKLETAFLEIMKEV